MSEAKREIRGKVLEEAKQAGGKLLLEHLVVEARPVLATVPELQAFAVVEVRSDDVLIYVFAKEHGIVPREALFDAEETLEERLGVRVELRVYAHQGRELASAFPGWTIHRLPE